MLSARVIPCLDVDNGRVVKGIKFKDIRDAGDPVLVAQAYEEQGADELVFLDITASSDNRNTVFSVVGWNNNLITKSKFGHHNGKIFVYRPVKNSRTVWKS